MMIWKLMHTLDQGDPTFLPLGQEYFPTGPKHQETPPGTVFKN
jgi:hypothetical protein